jgi:hypothetical protein
MGGILSDFGILSNSTGNQGVGTDNGNNNNGNNNDDDDADSDCSIDMVHHPCLLHQHIHDLDQRMWEQVRHQPCLLHQHIHEILIS